MSYLYQCVYFFLSQDKSLFDHNLLYFNSFLWHWLNLPVCDFLFYFNYQMEDAQSGLETESPAHHTYLPLVS